METTRLEGDFGYYLVVEINRVTPGLEIRSVELVDLIVE